MSRTHELRLIARIAQLYYGDGLKQAEISRLLHISQASISRLLARAQEEGIVRIAITAPRDTFPKTEAALRQRYGLEEAIVADCFEDREDAILSAIGAAAAHYFETTMADGEVIGISSWSASLLRMVDNIHPLKRVKAERVVQILGGIGNPSVQSHATQLTTRLAQLTGAEPMLLPAQGVAGSSAARLVMLGDSYVRATTDQFRRVTMALVGIGALQPSVMLANSGNSFTNEELQDLARRGAIGDVCLRFLDAEGRHVGGPLDERVMGMSLPELAAVPRVVAVAGGERKARPCTARCSAASSTCWSSTASPPSA
ncbi:Deoxyribonucleoside regulator [Methylobrevis pamukkalensis]|uniref:Deoxyribonucleoside regulator n=1 Tax=Methylobrevis pamukkalensis TaxID=1439726 RepID=A0A1E3H300_9HYPH|nr:Deoxyribonucleoside regulator [Methylobrevis pamukkalensis]